jgi:hypothetical protein
MHNTNVVKSNGIKILVAFVAILITSLTEVIALNSPELETINIALALSIVGGFVSVTSAIEVSML